jgi:VWFA-related protein
MSSAQATFAQDTSPHIRITQVDNSRFPQVTVYVSVTSAAGEPVGVNPGAIEISENGRPMQMTSVGSGGQAGVGRLATMLVVDVSGSMEKNAKIDGARKAATAYVDQMRPGDLAGLMVYNTKATYVQSLTADHSQLTSAIQGIKTGGDTAMYDALIAAEDALKDVSGRKAILAVTDGLDNSSSHRASDVIVGIGPAGLSISTIGLGDASSKAQTGLDESGLKSLAQQAGGLYSFAGDATSLTALFQSYGRALKNEYAISYTSPATLRDGVNRTLTVSLAGLSASAQVTSQYNPGGVLPEVATHSWPLFGAILLGLLALLLVPAMWRLWPRSAGGRRLGGRIKLTSPGPAPHASMARGRVKLK